MKASSILKKNVIFELLDPKLVSGPNFTQIRAFWNFADVSIFCCPTPSLGINYCLVGLPIVIWAAAYCSLGDLLAAYCSWERSIVLWAIYCYLNRLLFLGRPPIVLGRWGIVFLWSFIVLEESIVPGRCSYCSWERSIVIWVIYCFLGAVYCSLSGLLFPGGAPIVLWATTYCSVGPPIVAPQKVARIRWKPPTSWTCWTSGHANMKFLISA